MAVLFLFSWLLLCSHNFANLLCSHNFANDCVDLVESMTFSVAYSSLVVFYNR